MSMNVWNGMGRLTRDPEVKQTPSGATVANWTLAVDDDYQKDDTDFIDCVAWQATAEFVNKYFHKGKMMAATGRLKQRSWEKDGQKHSKMEVKISNVYFADSKRDGESGGSGSADSGSSNQAASPEGSFEELPDDGELPF